MKKFTFILMVLFASAGFTMAQTIENFEPTIQMNLMLGGAADLSTLSVVPNPDLVGNPSSNVVKFVRDKDGVVWGGFWGMATTKIDLTTNKYVHVKVWKPRISGVKVKIEKGSGAALEIASMNPQTVVNGWEELVFDFSTISGTFDGFNLMPDVLDPVGLTDDIVIYFDDLTVNNDPAIGSAALQVVSDFEIIKTNALNDQGSFALVANPDKSGINLSATVLDFTRLKAGVDWSGFWSALPTPTDVTTNKYVHVKLWKPRISVVKFKLQDGDAGTLEIASMNAQTTINAWEDFVFDFSSKTGTYPIIALIPDVTSDPLDADIHIYIDDIRVNNDPNPMSPPNQYISVDMNTAGLVEGDRVFISGNFGGVYGSWATPGENANNEMFDADGDKIYTVNMHLADGVASFKFFKNTGWGGGDPAGDRAYSMTGTSNLIYTWNAPGVVLAARENKLSGKIQMYPNPVHDVLNVNTSIDVRKVIITNTVGKIVGNVNYSSNQTINTSNLSKGIYFVTFVGRDGNKVTQKLIKD